MADSATSNLGLSKPGERSMGWGDKVNANFDKLDVIINELQSSVPANSLSYGTSVLGRWSADPTISSDQANPATAKSIASIIAGVSGGPIDLRLPPGTYNIWRNYTVPATVRLMPDKGAIIYPWRSVRESAFQWTASAHGTAEYYLELSGGGSPSVYEPSSVYADSVALAAGTAGSLTAGTWDWADNDGLGYATIYVRLADSTDPDTQASGYVEAWYTLGGLQEADPVWFGAKGDGITDDAAAFRAAIVAANIVNVPVATYKCNSRLEITKSNFSLKSDGATLDFSGISEIDGAYYRCLKIYGTGQTDFSVLASNATAGDYTVTVASGEGTKFGAGDYVQLTAEDLYNYAAASVKRGEIKQVQSVAGDVVTLREAVYESYTTANTATLRKISMIENISISGVKFIGTNTEGHKDIGVETRWVNGLRVENCRFWDIDLYELALFDTINFNIQSNHFNGVRYTGTGSCFYGVILFNCCQWGEVSGNIGQELRHLVTTSSSALYYGQPYFVTVTKNIINNAMAGDAYASWAYENHGFGRWISWIGNIADSCYTGINIEKGDQIISSNIFRNCRLMGINFDTDATELINIIVANNHISKTTTDSTTGTLRGISFASSAAQTRKNIIISGNIIEGFGIAGRSDMGIRVYPGNGSASGFVIANNIISTDEAYEATDHAIYIEQDGITVRGNSINGYERGVYLTASNCTIQNNEFVISGSPAGTYPAVSVGAGGDNNIITGNTFRNVYRGVSIGAGNNNQVIGNFQAGTTQTTVSDSGTGTVLTFGGGGF